MIRKCDLGSEVSTGHNSALEKCVICNVRHDCLALESKEGFIMHSMESKVDFTPHILSQGSFTPHSKEHTIGFIWSLRWDYPHSYTVLKEDALATVCTI